MPRLTLPTLLNCNKSLVLFNDLWLARVNSCVLVTNMFPFYTLYNMVGYGSVHSYTKMDTACINVFKDILGNGGCYEN